MPSAEDRIAAIINAFDSQVEEVGHIGSLLTAAIIRALANDLRRNGPTVELLGDFELEPVDAILSNRVTGALHRAVLEGRAPTLRRFYPSVGGSYSAGRDDVSLSRAVVETLMAERALLDEYLTSPAQTNEVGRSAGLMGGFLTIAKQTGLPLDIFEIGTSAGLNLCFDRYFYRFGDAQYGNPESSVHLAPKWYGTVPPVDATLAVRTRRGTDIAPIDLGTKEAPLRLESYVWPDQPERLQRLKAAIAIARSTEREIDNESADRWLARRLTPQKGAAQVVFHSMMWQYMPAQIRTRAEDTIRAAGECATSDAPIAWLELEPGASPRGYESRLTLWPGGETRCIAHVHPHGAWIEWRG